MARIRTKLSARSACRDLFLRFLSEEWPSDAHRLAALCRKLVDGRMLQVVDPRAAQVFIEEAGCGAFALPLREDAALATRHLRAASERVVGSARARLLQAMRGLQRTPRDDRFLHEAMYLGRVQQGAPTVASAGGSSAPRWTTALREGEELGDWLLALLATDVWEYAQLYRSGLSVCNACNAVTLDLAHPLPHRCARHADVADEELFDPRDLPTQPDIGRVPLG